jgi:nitrate reductase gamma subunit
VVPDRLAHYYCGHQQAKQIICGACDQWLEKLLRRRVRAYSERSDATYNLVLPRIATPATLMRAKKKYEGGGG